jgi:hypothetical protein
MFKFKDLYVLLPNTGLPTERAWIGCANTGCGGTKPEFLIPVRQFYGIDPDTFVDGVVVPFGQFGSLKDNLKAGLKAEEAREKTVQENQTPQTLAEVELLETKLTAALEELRARKAELRKS